MQSFRLKVQRIETTCSFELTWGQGQQLMALISYPARLTALYQDWQRAYLSFYKTVEIPLAPDTSAISNTELRARVAESGRINPGPVDWQAKLVQTETLLLHGFHHWLRSAELFEIRAAISAAHNSVGKTTAKIPETHDGQTTDSPLTNVFLTCYPLELARFPWETWELGAEFATHQPIRIIRTPANIQTTSISRKQRRKARILAILGDDTGLNFQRDRETVQSLARVTDITFVGWQPGQRPTEVKQQIQQALINPQGWDVLFFAGHSNEAAITGGELAIAPNTWLQMAEIAPQLATAKNQGLQVAIFNSCSGLNIAESLIGIGFSQVVVMREPIHNRVAQEFLVQFLRCLATHQTLQEAMLAACQFLRCDRNLTYPSAWLVPSLFAHPGAELFRIPAFGWKQRLQQFLPTPVEAGAIAACLILSLFPPIQNWLLDQRVGLQAVYRDVTYQIPPATAAPVTLVQIDEESIRRDRRIANPTQINRAYLADLITHLTEQKAPVIGIDYLLDRSVGSEDVLNQVLKTAVQQHRTWFVFGAPYNDFETKGVFAAQKSGIAQPEWSLQGHASILPTHVTLPYTDEDCRQTCPFAYLLSLLQLAQREFPTLPQPDLESTTNLRTQILEAIRQQPVANPAVAALERSRLSPISGWFYENFEWVSLNPWLEPILDFSIPPDRIYNRIAAWRVLEKPLQLPNLPAQVALIGGGEYTDGGIVGEQLDIYPLPRAVQYWHSHLSPNNPAGRFANGNSQNSPDYLPILTGAEVHAYILHHLLTQRLVIPIPDSWMVAMAALVGAALKVGIRRQGWTVDQYRLLGILVLATGLYGLASLQLYIAAAILLPWLLPSCLIGLFVLSTVRKKSNG